MSIIMTLVHSLQRIYTEFITNWSKMSSSSLLNIMYLSQGRTDFSNEWGKRRMRRWFPLGVRVCVCMCKHVIKLNALAWKPLLERKEKKQHSLPSGTSVQNKTKTTTNTPIDSHCCVSEKNEMKRTFTYNTVSCICVCPFVCSLKHFTNIRVLICFGCDFLLFHQSH